MLRSEEDWTRATRWTWAFIGLSLVGLLASGPLIRWTGVDPVVFVGAFGGLLGGGLMSLLWLRKPKLRPSEAEIERLERQNLPVMMVSVIATWSMLALFSIVTIFEPQGALFWGLTALGFLCLVVALAVMPRLIRHVRASRVAPELHDERSQLNLDVAYRRAGFLTFQVAFLGGLALMHGVVELPAEAVAMGLGILWIFTASVVWIWLDWRDARAS